MERPAGTPAFFLAASADHVDGSSASVLVTPRSGPRPALHILGVFATRADDPVNDGLRERRSPVLTPADAAPGPVARSGRASDPGPEPWGEEVHRRFVADEHEEGRAPATPSLRRDLGSALASVGFDVHADATSRGREWFRRRSWPPLTLRRRSDEVHPRWAEGVRRRHHPHDDGPTPQASTFAARFDPTDAPSRIDRTRAKPPAVGAPFPRRG